MPITDLTGTKWQFNDTITDAYIKGSEFLISGSIQSDNILAQLERISSNASRDNFIILYSDKQSAYYPFIQYYTENGWQLRTSASGRTNIDAPVVEITGGDNVTNADLIKWFEANAMQIVDNQKEIFEANMAELNDILNEKAGTSGQHTIVQMIDVASSIQVGGEQPTLFAPIITQGVNKVSWANDTRNGGFNPTITATIDGNTVTSPLTITEQMDGKTLIVTASAIKFESAVSQVELEYVAPPSGKTEVNMVGYSGTQTKAALYVGFYAADPNIAGIKVYYNDVEYANNNSRSGFLVPFDISSHNELNLKIKYGATATLTILTVGLADIAQQYAGWVTGTGSSSDFCTGCTGSTATVYINGNEYASASGDRYRVNFANISVVDTDIITISYTATY